MALILCFILSSDRMLNHNRNINFILKVLIESFKCSLWVHFSFKILICYRLDNILPCSVNGCKYVLFLFHSQLSVRGKNKKEKIGGFFKSITKTADEVLLANQKVIIWSLNTWYILYYWNTVEFSAIMNDFVCFG